MAMTAPLEVGICVSDLDAMTKFYVDVLGCEEKARATIPPARSELIGLGTDGFAIVWLQTQWGERLKLVRPGADPAPATDQAHLIARRGVAYLTFYVDDISAAGAAALAAGARLVSETPTVEAGPGTWVAFFQDPEGNAFEFVERADVAAYRPDLAAKGR